MEDFFKERMSHHLLEADRRSVRSRVMLIS